ncbi:MAG: hypothetical protein ACP5E9_09295 [Candidatus Methanospirareceae archaeon]
MAKFLTLWEMDTTRMSESPEEQIRYQTMMVKMVKEDLKRNITLDGGIFAGGELGDTPSVKGLNKRLPWRIGKYLPYIKVKTYPILSVNQVAGMIPKVLTRFLDSVVSHYLSVV